MFKQEETGHIKTYHFSLTYSDKDSLNKLLECLGDYRTDKINNIIKTAQAIYKTQEHIKVSVRVREFRHKITGEIKTQIPLFDMASYEEVSEEEHEQKQKEIKQDINKLFVANALKEGLTIEEIKQI